MSYKQFRILLYLFTVGLLSACGQSSTPSPSPSPSPTGTVNISGTLTYDYVPHSDNGGLNYNATEPRPIRGATVELLSTSDSVLDTTRSDANGEYTLSASDSTTVRVRVKAQYTRSASPTWDVSVTDNTDSNALYVMDGALLTSGTSNSVRDLHAQSGWGLSSYTGDRTAAPFAILDSVYELLNELEDEGLSDNLPATELRWSINNTPSSGSLADGDIGTSFFNPENLAMYILGDEDTDTDEYDRSVIQHEFGHYLETAISRSESVGGSHGFGDLLDMRVVYSEGFANALTALASGTGYYEDSQGTEQQFGFRFSVEDVSDTAVGWYSESTITAMVYDLADPANEAGDDLDLGLGGIIDALTSNEYKNNSAFATIYLLLEVLKNSNDSATATDIAEYAASHEIYGSDEWGSGETNDGDVSIALPVYSELDVGESINVCSNDNEGQNNGLDVRRFIRLNVSQNGSHTFSMIKTNQGTGNADPDMVLWRDGQFEGVFESTSINQETATVNLVSGTYVLEAYDYDNVDGSGGIQCFDISVVRN